jgi:outer membrane protein OmpA-like peptidoglycan-associated protein
MPDGTQFLPKGKLQGTGDQLFGISGRPIAAFHKRGERFMKNGKAVLGAVVGLSLFAGGCATKKHVREAIAPVQNQVNTVQKQSADNRQAIGDLDRQVATADEKATDAGKRASAAGEAAANANTAAGQARTQADAANAAAQQAQQGVARLDQSLKNLDNYKLVSTEKILFRPGRSALSKEDQDKLDAVLQNVTAMKSYVIEVQGYADRTGSKAANAELSRRRADSVVHYLAVEHNVPLRDIHELGVGSDFPNADNRTRGARKENRRVEVKVYALDLNGQMQSSLNGSTPTATPQNSPNPQQP